MTSHIGQVSGASEPGPSTYLGFEVKYSNYLVLLFVAQNLPRYLKRAAEEGPLRGRG